MTTDEREDDRRRRGVLVLLLGAVLLLLLGLLGGYVLFGPDPATGAAGTPEPQASRPSLVRPSGEPAARPTGETVVVDGGGQAVSQPATGSGAGTAVASSGARLATSSRVVGDIAPGRPATLALTVTNPGARPVVLVAVTARVTSVGSTPSASPACSPDWYGVEPFHGARTVPAGGSTTLELRVVFLDSPTLNQDSCKGATYSYSYRVEATQG